MIKVAAAVVQRQREMVLASATTRMRIGACRPGLSTCNLTKTLFSNPIRSDNSFALHIGRAFSAQASRLADFASFGIGGPNGVIRPSARPLPLMRNRRRRLPARYKRSSVAAEEVAIRSKMIPVSAIHMAQTIDIYTVVSKVFAGNCIRKQMFGKNSFAVELVPHTPDDKPRYAAVFRFGSIVFFNVTPREIASLVTDIKKHSLEPVLSGLERTEKFGVLVSEGDGITAPATIFVAPEEEAPVVTGDYCIVEELDLNGVAVIGNIMAQTVALDSYNDTVDSLLANFARINSSVTKTGSFTSTDKNFLFKTVAQNNSIFIDMISKIRIKDRSDTAWNLTKYEKIHYGMKDEFEIDDRFEHIEFKLNLIQQNAKFFLEVLQHQKTNSLEWIIVVLITLECGLMCVDMSGMGDSMFGAISSLVSSLTGGRS